MRAYNIAVAIFLLSLSLSTAKAAFGYQANNEPLWTVDSEQVRSAATIRSYDPTGGILDTFRMLGSAVSFLYNILYSAAMLGSTIQSLIPFPLPNVFVMGLNMLGATAMTFALFQFVLGRSARTME